MAQCWLLAWCLKIYFKAREDKKKWHLTPALQDQCSSKNENWDFVDEILRNQNISFLSQFKHGGANIRLVAGRIVLASNFNQLNICD